MVGLCSYLLINFWWTRIQANKSAIKAMVVNRVGDLGLTLGILATFYTFGAVDFATIFALAPHLQFDTTTFLHMEVNNITLIGLLFLIGAVGKSAQLGLHTWLPDAMEGKNKYMKKFLLNLLDISSEVYLVLTRLNFKFISYLSQFSLY